MSLDRAELIRPVIAATGEPDAGLLLLLLNPKQVSVLSEQPTSERVDDLLPTLKARMSNAERRGLRVIGLRQLIQRLEELRHSDRVLGYGISAPHAAGNLYYVDKAQRPVALGAAIIQH